jgi:hypothetical protein
VRLKVESQRVALGPVILTQSGGFLAGRQPNPWLLLLFLTRLRPRFYNGIASLTRSLPPSLAAAIACAVGGAICGHERGAAAGPGRGGTATGCDGGSVSLRIRTHRLRDLGLQKIVSLLVISARFG